MDKSTFLRLLHKYLDGHANSEEKQFLSGYYNLFESEPDVVVLMRSNQRNKTKDQIQQEIWKNIALKNYGTTGVRPLWRNWVARISAAALVLIVSTAAVLYFINHKPAKQVALVRSVENKGHRLIRLADGSTVIVGSGSKLNYPSSFDGMDKREVYLEGQAYFDIKHNSSKPFIVHTGRLETTVLGTAFNIKAWPAEEDIIVTVTRGKVKVDDHHKLLGVITPNQQITYHKPEKSASQKKVDSQAYLTWKDQDLLFDDVTVADAAELLEERFKVRISFSDEQIRSKRFSTIFYKDESLDHVLKSICEFNNAAYHFNKENATIAISSRE
ncbi:FecR domain-containing protein [Daejeonella sp.]|uniref:FecR domain-containing protein n=1 Tax=Daejeonella sp. TaxID=2805397 RepID=UPI0030BCB657